MSRWFFGGRNEGPGATNFFTLLGSAQAAAAAARLGRQPRANDLRALGIDPAVYASIKQD